MHPHLLPLLYPHLEYSTPPLYITFRHLYSIFPTNKEVHQEVQGGVQGDALGGVLGGAGRGEQGGDRRNGPTLVVAFSQKNAASSPLKTIHSWLFARSHQ